MDGLDLAPTSCRALYTRKLVAVVQLFYPRARDLWNRYLRPLPTEDWYWQMPRPDSALGEHSPLHHPSRRRHSVGVLGNSHKAQQAAASGKLMDTPNPEVVTHAAVSELDTRGKKARQTPREHGKPA